MERPQMIINRNYHIQDDDDVYTGTLIRTSRTRTNEYKYKFDNLRKLEIRPNQPNYYRRIIAEKNPWNAKNYLQLGINYRETGDIENMQKMLAKIESFASDTDVYSKAKLELVVPR